MVILNALGILIPLVLTVNSFCSRNATCEYWENWSKDLWNHFESRHSYKSKMGKKVTATRSHSAFVNRNARRIDTDDSNQDDEQASSQKITLSTFDGKQMKCKSVGQGNQPGFSQSSHSGGLHRPKSARLDNDLYRSLESKTPDQTIVHGQCTRLDSRPRSVNHTRPDNHPQSPDIS